MFSIFLFCIHLVFALYMFGVIWFIQLVHYPLFIFMDYDSSHNPFIFQQTRSGIVIALPMILELTSIILLIFTPFPNFFSVLILLVLSLLIWLTTFTMQVPVQNLLKKEKNVDAMKRLLYTNWFRTVLWSLKAFYLFFLLWNLLEDSIVVIC